MPSDTWPMVGTLSLPVSLVITAIRREPFVRIDSNAQLIDVPERVRVPVFDCKSAALLRVVEYCVGELSAPAAQLAKGIAATPTSPPASRDLRVTTSRRPS